MTDEPRPRMPAALLLGLALMLLSTLAGAVVFKPEALGGMRIRLAIEGVGTASDLILMGGVFVLARRLAGTANTGARIVGYLLGARFALVILWAIFDCWLFTRSDGPRMPESFYTVMQLVSLAMSLGAALGWIVAAGGLVRRIALAIPTLILAFLVAMPQLIAEPVFEALDAGPGMHAMFRIALDVLVLVLAFLACRGTREVAVAEDASNGLRLAASGLWLRVVAAISLVGLTLLLAGAGARDGAKLLKVVMLLGQAVNIFALIRFGLGALQTAGSDAPDVPRYPFAIGGALSLWSASVMILQTPWLFEMMYGDHASWATESAQTFAIAQPLVAAAGIVFVVIGISGAASRRALSEIGDLAGSRGAAFVALTLASILMQTLLLPSVSSMSGFLLISLAIAVAGFVAVVQIAKLCGSAADQLDLEPGLPRATLRVNDPP